MQRYIWSGMLGLSVFFLPFWVTSILVVVGSILFDRYFEALIAMIVVDVLYSTSLAQFWHIPCIMSLVTLVWLLILAYVKSFFISYEHH